jgi:hypothetical protein
MLVYVKLIFLLHLYNTKHVLLKIVILTIASMMVVVNTAHQQNSISLRHLKVTLTLLLLFFLIMIDQIKASF